MCSVCGQYPCSAQCPNADEQPVLYCSVCNSPIYHDYDYFEVCGVIYCEDCMDSHRFDVTEYIEDTAYEQQMREYEYAQDAKADRGDNEWKERDR